MANSFYTPTMVAAEFVRILENELVMGKMVGSDLSSEFKGEKPGSTVYVRRQMQYLGQDNNLDLSAYSEDVIEGTVAVAMDKTWSDKVVIGATDRSLSFDRWSDMVIAPMARRAAEKIEASLVELYPYFYNFSGTPGTTASTFAALAGAGAIMTNAGVNRRGRLAFHSPDTAAALAGTVAATYVSGDNKTALQEAEIGRFGGFTNYETPFAPTHTVGAHGGTPLVNGASQNVTYATAKNTWTQSLITDGWTNSITGILKAGDVFTVAGVYAINPNTKASTGRLQDFTVIADANSGASTGPSTITISPPMITSGAWQTVSAAPADNAAITVKTGTASTAYRHSLLLDPAAIALVTRPLDIPGDAGLKTSTKTGNKVTVSISEYTVGDTLAHNMRFDMLWGRVVLDARKGSRLTS